MIDYCDQSQNKHKIKWKNLQKAWFLKFYYQYIKKITIFFRHERPKSLDKPT